MNAKTLMRELNITQEQAKLVMGLMKGTIDPFTVEQTNAWRLQCYHEPDPDSPETIMHAIDATLGTFGCEAIWGRNSCIQPVAEYCNNGDTYAATILYDYEAEKYRLTSWGDFVERFERRYDIGD